ncbi:MAG TPA: universal stress protein, partial [Bacteroidetes bacterium]|nr:universal stress protein [Bacteroidota bacterium]
KTGGKLYIVSAYQMPYSSRSVIRSMRDKLQETTEANMEALRERLKSEPSEVPFEAYVREKDAVELILDAADHFEVDMIVMGTKGSSGLEEVILGSNTAEVVEKAKQPVLAVPRNAFFFGFKRITFATDLAKGSSEAARRLLSLTAPFNTIVDLLNVFPEKEVAPTNGLESLSQDLKSEFESREIHTFLVANDSIQEGLVEHMTAHASEALVMLTRHRTLFQKLFDRSLTKKLTMQANLPILVLHD